jgi:hypothetical protein
MSLRGSSVFPRELRYGRAPESQGTLGKQIALHMRMRIERNARMVARRRLRRSLSCLSTVLVLLPTNTRAQYAPSDPDPSALGGPMDDAPWTAPTSTHERAVEREFRRATGVTSSARSEDFQDLIFEARGSTTELQVRDADEWRTVCIGSCKTNVSTRAKHRVAGTGVTPTKEFLVDWDRETITLHAREGSIHARDLGTVLVPIGTVVLALGFLSLACVYCSDAARTRSVITTGIGAAAMGVGFALMNTNNTHVAFSTKSLGLLREVSLGRGLTLSPDGIRF